MLYRIAHFLQDKLSFLWRWIEDLNSFFFKWRYKKKLSSLPLVLQNCTYITKMGDELSVRLASIDDAVDLESFFCQQPLSAFKFFKPHSFERASLEKLIKRTSFIVMVAIIDNQIVGYFFLRSFVHGRCFLGKMVDCKWQGVGIGKTMCNVAMMAAAHIGMRMFESINRENVASLRSSSVLKQVIVQELDNGDVLIEDFPLC